jgi:hypothetical protein
MRARAAFCTYSVPAKAAIKVENIWRDVKASHNQIIVRQKYIPHVSAKGGGGGHESTSYQV